MFHFCQQIAEPYYEESDEIEQAVELVDDAIVSSEDNPLPDTKNEEPVAFDPKMPEIVPEAIKTKIVTDSGKILVNFVLYCRF